MYFVLSSPVHHFSHSTRFHRHPPPTTTSARVCSTSSQAQMIARSRSIDGEWWTFRCQIYIFILDFRAYSTFFITFSSLRDEKLYIFNFFWHCRYLSSWSLFALQRPKIDCRPCTSRVLSDEQKFGVDISSSLRVARHSNPRGLMLWTVNNPNTFRKMLFLCYFIEFSLFLRLS